MWETFKFLKRDGFYRDTSGPLLALREWDYDDAAFQVLRMEDLMRDIDKVLMSRLIRHFGERAPSETNVRSHYRSGDPDNWKRELPADLIEHVVSTSRKIFENSIQRSIFATERLLDRI
jgi:predicted site-specific integrase-resolvase